MKKVLVFLISISLLFTCLATNVFAANCTASASASSSSVYVGSSVKVTFTFSSSSNIGSADVQINFDSSKLTFVSCSSSLGSGLSNVVGELIKVSDFSVSGSKTYTVTATFTAKSVGSASVSISSSDITATTDDPLGSPKASTAISIKNKSASGDCNLTSLTAPAGCTLSPNFSANTTEYTCTVPYSVAKFPLDWKLSDSEANAKATGSVDLSVGENTRKVTVTAPNGTQKVYTVKITRQAQNETVVPTAAPETPVAATTININSIDYTLEQIITIAAPEGFDLTSIAYGDTTTDAYKLGNITLLQLTNDTETALFIYYAESGMFVPYKSISNKAVSYTYLSTPEDLSFETSPATFTLGGVEYEGLTSNVLGDGYYIFKALTPTGETVNCVYCAIDDSIQRLSASIGNTSAEAQVVQPEAKSLLAQTWYYIAIALLIMALALFIILYISCKKPTGKKKTHDNGHDWNIELDNDDSYDDSLPESDPEEIIFDDFK